MTAWICKPWAELALEDLYRILGARQRVFCVEQNCPYLDTDDHDQEGWHLWTTGADGAIAAYLRILPPASKYVEASIGRVLTASEARRTGLGRTLMAEGIRRLEQLLGPRPIRIGAQKYLERFYADFGFARAGDDYDEDGIPHLEMVRPQSASA